MGGREVIQGRGILGADGVCRRVGAEEGNEDPIQFELMKHAPGTAGKFAAGRRRGERFLRAKEDVRNAKRLYNMFSF